jgi:hypothetical protein
MRFANSISKWPENNAKGSSKNNIVESLHLAVVNMKPYTCTVTGIAPFTQTPTHKLGMLFLDEP